MRSAGAGRSLFERFQCAAPTWELEDGDPLPERSRRSFKELAVQAVG